MIDWKTANLRQIMAGMMCVTALVVLLFSSVYLAIESGHECDGDECPVCACLQVCENNMKQIGSGIPVVALLYSVILWSLAVICQMESVLPATLVSRKVRMNN